MYIGITSHLAFCWISDIGINIWLEKKWNMLRPLLPVTRSSTSWYWDLVLLWNARGQQRLPELARMRNVPLGLPGNRSCLSASRRSIENHHLQERRDMNPWWDNWAQHNHHTAIHNFTRTKSGRAKPSFHVQGQAMPVLNYWDCVTKSHIFISN